MIWYCIESLDIICGFDCLQYKNQSSTKEFYKFDSIQYKSSFYQLIDVNVQ